MSLDSMFREASVKQGPEGASARPLDAGAPRQVWAGWGFCRVCRDGRYSTACMAYSGSGDTASSSCTTCGHAWGNHS